MITFETLKWKNFLSTGDQWIELNLNSTTSTLIVGANGAGKSTLLKAILRMVPTLAGEIEVASGTEHEVTRCQGLASEIGYVGIVRGHTGPAYYDALRRMAMGALIVQKDT